MSVCHQSLSSFSQRCSFYNITCQCKNFSHLNSSQNFEGKAVFGNEHYVEGSMQSKRHVMFKVSKAEEVVHEMIVCPPPKKKEKKWKKV